jgi:hypothetical protein
MIALMLELTFLPALAFAVGVYLPLSSSSPIFIGGFIRWLVDRKTGVEEGDKGPGVLMASGYIAFLAGVLGDFDAAVGKWAAANNPFFDGVWSDALSLLPFALLGAIHLRAGRSRA